MLLVVHQHVHLQHMCVKEIMNNQSHYFGEGVEQTALAKYVESIYNHNVSKTTFKAICNVWNIQIVLHSSADNKNWNKMLFGTHFQKTVHIFFQMNLFSIPSPSQTIHPYEYELQIISAKQITNMPYNDFLGWFQDNRVEITQLPVYD